MAHELKGIALCAVGMESICSKELAKLGLRVLDRKPGRLGFALDKADPASSLAKANIGLRCAQRVLLELGHFPARDFDQFFDGMKSLPWELCCFKDSALVIDRVRSHDSALAAQTSIQAMGQKAAYTRLMEHYRMRTMPATANKVAARVYLDSDVCTVGVDSSGEPLSKRGYRKRSVEAPLNEAVAAGLLFLSGWNRRYALLDPFCGSGTIAIEAALFALDFAPGLQRRFALEAMPFASARTIGAVRESFEARIRQDVDVEIVASDIDPGALEAARQNAYDAGVSDWIEFRLAKAQESLPGAKRGFLLANPPYGKRLGTEEEAAELYSSLSSMRARFEEAGWGMGFVAEREDFGEIFGRAPATSTRILSGSEELWFHWYPQPKDEPLGGLRSS